MSAHGVFRLIMGDRRYRPDIDDAIEICQKLPAWGVEISSMVAAIGEILPRPLLRIISELVGPQYALAIHKLDFEFPSGIPLVTSGRPGQAQRKLSAFLDSVTGSMRHIKRQHPDAQNITQIMIDIRTCAADADSDHWLDLTYRFILATWEPRLCC